MNRFRTLGVSARSRWPAFLAASLAIVFAAHAAAQAPAAEGGAVGEASAEELEKLVGPIALYPDDLVAIVLPAATNPLQLVQAERFLDKRKEDPKLPVDENWDDAVKSLLNYPDIVKMMSRDLDWTTTLGEAVVDNQGAVMDAIQSFRRKTQFAGNLKSDEKQAIVVEKEVIKIVPADPQVIYVPQYNPTTVVVQSAAPVYVYSPPYPSYYYPYPPGAALATGIIWGAAIGAAWNGGYYGTNWGGNNNNNITINRNANINSGNINTGNINRGDINRGDINRGDFNRRGASTLPAGSRAWQSNKRPGQVSGGIAGAATRPRVGDRGTGRDFGAAASTRPSVGDRGTGRDFGASASTRPSAAGRNSPDSARGARNFTGSADGRARNSAPSAGTGSRKFSGSADRPARGASGGNAFGGYGSGRQTQRDSARGSSSRGSMQRGGARGGGRRR
jgi:Protein of unknown function (DUF3300)